MYLIWFNFKTLLYLFYLILTDESNETNESPIKSILLPYSDLFSSEVNDDIELYEDEDGSEIDDYLEPSLFSKKEIESGEFQNNEDTIRAISLNSIKISNTLKHKFIPNECKSSYYQRFGGYKLTKNTKKLKQIQMVKNISNSIFIIH